MLVLHLIDTIPFYLANPNDGIAQPFAVTVNASKYRISHFHAKQYDAKMENHSNQRHEVLVKHTIYIRKFIDNLKSYFFFCSPLEHHMYFITWNFQRYPEHKFFFEYSCWNLMNSKWQILRQHSVRVTSFSNHAHFVLKTSKPLTKRFVIFHPAIFFGIFGTYVFKQTEFL